MKFHFVPRQLLYVEAVAEHGSVQAASRALGIAASAIDRHIKTLEEINRAPLFERLPRGMRPTVAGEAVVVMARRWRRDAERLETELQEIRGQERGIVRIVAMDSLTNGVLADLQAWRSTEYPHLQISADIVAPSDAARLLDEGAVEVAIVFNIPKLRHQHVLWTDNLRFGCVVAPDHALAALKEVTLAQLSGHALVSQSAVLPIRQYLDARYAWFFAENAPVLASNSLQLLKRALRQGNAAMITSELDVLPEILSGDLKFLPLKDRGLAPPSISVVIDARRPLSRAARLVSEFLVERTTRSLERVRNAAQ